MFRTDDFDLCGEVYVLHFGVIVLLAVLLSDSLEKSLFSISAFFKVVVIIRLLIKRLLFQDLDEPHQLVHSS